MATAVILRIFAKSPSFAAIFPQWKKARFNACFNIGDRAISLVPADAGLHERAAAGPSAPARPPHGGWQLP